MKKHRDIDLGDSGGGAPTKTGNALFTIFPYKKGNTWMFDDESRGIVMEPFVGGADTLLDKVCGGKSEITAIFSPTPFRDHQFVLEKVEGDEYGTTFRCPEYDNHEAWLCPALFAYLYPAPDKIYVQIKH